MVGYWMDIGLSLVDIRVFHPYGYCCNNCGGCTIIPRSAQVAIIEN